LCAAPSRARALPSSVVAIGLETARAEWEGAARTLESQRGEQPHYGRLLVQLEVVSAELRKRVGQTFTLDELARAYADAERWAREAVSEHAATPGWARDLSLVTAAAFHAYQRGATDYEP
jgi:hypothetical protein